MIDLGRLRVLRELKLRGTVGTVAEALGYTPSAVSQQLAQLQRDIGVPLTERVGRRLRLTEAGEALAHESEALLAQAQRAEEAALAACGLVAGTVRVVGFQTALIHLVAPALATLAADYPQLSVEVLDDEFERVLQDLVLQEVDFVLTNEYENLPRARRDDLTAEILVTEPAKLVMPAGHRLADGPVHVADLAAERWAHGYPGTAHFEMTEKVCLEYGRFRPDVRTRSNDLLVVLALVAQGQAIALLPELVSAQDTTGVVIRELEEIEIRRQIVLWTRVGADTRPSIRAVRDALRSAADALVAGRPALTRGG